MIDLHAHTTASDGSDTPAELIRNAAAAGVHTLAITDHDTTGGWDEASAAVAQLDVAFTLIRGTEFSCIYDTGGTWISLHLLGYLFDPTHPELAREMELLRTDRTRRAAAMVDKLVELGAPVSWEQVRRIAGDAAVGRPHVARALVDAGVVPDVAAAFTAEWIGNDGRAYVEKYSLTPQHAIALVKAAGGVSVFAHPAASSRGKTVNASAIEAFAEAGLDGIEVDHPDHDSDARAQLRALAAQLRLLPTGSSDYHGMVKSTPLGAESTDPAVFEELVGRATGAQVVRG